MSKKLWVENIENYPAIIYQEEAPSEDFDDESSDMMIWDTSIDIMDWSRRRDVVAPLFYEIASNNLSTYGNLTPEQKLIGAKYFLVPYSLRVTNGTVTEAEDKVNWSSLLVETKISRLACVEAMRIHVGHYIRTGLLTLVQTQQFFKDVFQLIEWFNEANLPDFKQWVTNEVGSSYESSGFEQTAYWSQQLENELMEIYNGNY